MTFSFVSRWDISSAARLLGAGCGALRETALTSLRGDEPWHG